MVQQKLRHISAGHTNTLLSNLRTNIQFVDTIKIIKDLKVLRHCEEREREKTNKFSLSLYSQFAHDARSQKPKACSDMFPITEDPSSGSLVQYLTKITRMVLSCPLTWT